MAFRLAPRRVDFGRTGTMVQPLNPVITEAQCRAWSPRNAKTDSSLRIVPPSPEIYFIPNYL